MQIETKFNIGDMVYWITKEPQRIPVECDVCFGKKKIMVITNSLLKTTKEYQCWNCINGLYRIENYGWAKYGKDKIISCTTHLYDKGTLEVGYKVLNEKTSGIMTVRQENCFKTQYNAQKACDKRNKAADIPQKK